MADDTLERLARDEILKETQRASVRANQIGPQGWKKCPIPATNKRFLLNTLVGTLSKSGNTKKRQLHEAEMNACKKRSEPNKSTGDNVVIKKSRRNIRTNCEQVKRSSHAPSNESRKKNCTVDTTSQSNS